VSDSTVRCGGIQFKRAGETPALRKAGSARIAHMDASWETPRKIPTLSKTERVGHPKNLGKTVTTLFVVVVGAADGDWLGRVAPFAAVPAEEFMGGFRSPLA
jgi:hypothetical protein